MALIIEKNNDLYSQIWNKNCFHKLIYIFLTVKAIYNKNNHNYTVKSIALINRTFNNLNETYTLSDVIKGYFRFLKLTLISLKIAIGFIWVIEDYNDNYFLQCRLKQLIINTC